MKGAQTIPKTGRVFLVLGFLICSGCSTPGSPVFVGLEWQVDLATSASSVAKPQEPAKVRLSRESGPLERALPLKWRVEQRDKRTPFRRGAARGADVVSSATPDRDVNRRSVAVARAQKWRDYKTPTYNRDAPWLRRLGSDLLAEVRSWEPFGLVHGRPGRQMQGGILLDTEVVRGQFNDALLADAHVRVSFEVHPGRLVVLRGISHNYRDLESENPDWRFPADVSQSTIVVGIDKHLSRDGRVEMRQREAEWPDLIGASWLDDPPMNLRNENDTADKYILVEYTPAEDSTSGRDPVDSGEVSWSGGREVSFRVTIQAPPDQPLRGHIDFVVVTAADWDRDDSLFTTSRAFRDQLATWYAWREGWRTRNDVQTRRIQRSLQLDATFWRVENGTPRPTSSNVREVLNGEPIEPKGWIARSLGL